MIQWRNSEEGGGGGINGRREEEEKGEEKTETPELTNRNVAKCQEQKSSGFLQDFGKDD